VHRLRARTRAAHRRTAARCAACRRSTRRGPHEWVERRRRGCGRRTFAPLPCGRCERPRLYRVEQSASGSPRTVAHRAKTSLLPAGRREAPSLVRAPGVRRPGRLRLPLVPRAVRQRPRSPLAQRGTRTPAAQEPRWERSPQAAPPARPAARAEQAPLRPAPWRALRDAPAAGRADRRNPAHRWSYARRSRRTAGHLPPCRQHRRRIPLAPPHRVSPRSSPDAATSPCTRTASVSKSSSRRSGLCPRTTRLLRPAPAPESRWMPRGRCRGAGPPCRASRCRGRTAAGPGRQPATSTHGPRKRVGRERIGPPARVAAQIPPLLSDLRTVRG
jgi:hypothetical protein